MRYVGSVIDKEYLKAYQEHPREGDKDYYNPLFSIGLTFGLQLIYDYQKTRIYLDEYPEQKKLREYFLAMVRIKNIWFDAVEELNNEI